MVLVKRFPLFTKVKNFYFTHAKKKLIQSTIFFGKAGQTGALSKNDEGGFFRLTNLTGVKIIPITKCKFTVGKKIPHMHLFILSHPVFAKEFLGNPVESYVWLVVIILTGIVFKHIISRFLTRLLYRICAKYSSGVGPEKFVELLMAPFNMFIMLVIFYLAFDRMVYPNEWNLAPKEVFGFKMVIFKTFLILIAISITWIFLRLTDYFGLILFHRASLTYTKTDDQLVPFIKESIKIVIALFGLLFILGSIFQVNVASIIAGLGIGGIAVALAAKESLENLLGSVTIFLDKPFTMGDLIRIDKVTGHVEKIGFRSTRIRTQEKTFVTVPNKTVIASGVENMTLRNLFRAKFLLNLSYASTPDQINGLISDIRSYLEKRELVEPNAGVFLSGFSPTSIDIAIQFLVRAVEWEDYMAVKEDVNFRLMEMMARHGCSFANATTQIIFEDPMDERHQKINTRAR